MNIQKSFSSMSLPNQLQFMSPSLDEINRSHIKPIDQNKQNSLKDTDESIAEKKMPAETFIRTHLKFVYHDELKDYYVEIINPQTDEVIKEIPPKKFLDMYASMIKIMGLFIDQEI